MKPFFTTNRIWFDVDGNKLMTFYNFDNNRDKLEQLILSCLNKYTFIIDRAVVEEEHIIWSEGNREFNIWMKEIEDNERRDRKVNVSVGDIEYMDRASKKFKEFEENRRHGDMSHRDRDREPDRYDNKSRRKYHLKYLKYKNKYLKLKKLIQLD